MVIGQFDFTIRIDIFQFIFVFKHNSYIQNNINWVSKIFQQMPLIPSSTKMQKKLISEVNYKNFVKQRFKQQVNRIIQKYSLQQMVLVVNLSTALLISNLFKIPELVEMKIIYLQRLQVKRKRMNTLHAIYFLTPTAKSIEMLKNDFPQKAFGEEKSKNHYKKVHILFTSFLSHSLLKEIATYKPLLKRIATDSIKEFYHSSRFLSNTVIDFGLEGYGSVAFSKDSAEQTEHRIRISQKIMQVVVNMGEVNTVRIFYKRSPNCISQRVAQYAQKTINKHIGNMLTNKSHLLKQQADDITILLFDRSIDAITPLLHSFTYEAILFDLAKVAFEGSPKLQDKQYYNFKDFDDETYAVYRYQHISKALQEIPELLNKQNQKLIQLQKPGNTGNKLQDNDVDITELNQKVKAYRTHIQLLDMLIKEVKARQLTDLGQLQMSLATGLTEQGKNTSSSALFNQVLQNIQNNQKITKQQKIRLALLVLCTIKLSKKDYEFLLSKFIDEQDKWTLKNIIALGITYDKSISKSTKAITKDQQSIATQRLQKTGMPLDRHTPILELVVPTVEQILSGQNPKKKRLDESLFGSLKCTWLDEQKLDIIKFNRQRFVIVMLGGMSFAQISSIRRKEQLKDVIIAADEILTTQKYLNMLKNIDILKQRK